MKAKIRSIHTFIEETHADGGKTLAKPTRKAACAVVFKNPFAGQFVDDLTPLVELSKELGELLTVKAVAALGIQVDEVESYGKAAIAGLAGEREHCAALMHPALGTPIRANVGGGKALLPSAKKLGGPGCAIDLPLGHKNAAYVRSHFDAMEVGVTDAPKADELVFILVMTTGPRVHARVGGLAADQIKGEDGLR